VGEMSSRGRFATPADFPRHDCSPYRGLHERRESVGFVHRSTAMFCRPVPSPSVPIRNFLPHRCESAYHATAHAVSLPPPNPRRTRLSAARLRPGRAVASAAAAALRAQRAQLAARPQRRRQLTCVAVGGQERFQRCDHELNLLVGML
jgi:hypothetical protein